jgi:hypothetical protein
MLGRLFVGAKQYDAKIADLQVVSQESNRISRLADHAVIFTPTASEWNAGECPPPLPKRSSPPRGFTLPRD